VKRLDAIAKSNERTGVSDRGELNVVRSVAVAFHRRGSYPAASGVDEQYDAYAVHFAGHFDASYAVMIASCSYPRQYQSVKGRRGHKIKKCFVPTYGLVDEQPRATVD
jgi:hypothetical protein